MARYKRRSREDYPPEMHPDDIAALESATDSERYSLAEALSSVLSGAGGAVRSLWQGLFGKRTKRPEKPPGAVEPEDQDDEWPDEHDIELLPEDETMRLPGGGAQGRVYKEIFTAGSSNVYSFLYHHKTKHSGILYVTFLGWRPGAKERSGRGTTYAYYNVPPRVYFQFESMASKSAGGAVWDYLRVRGSRHAHQYQYRLVQGYVDPHGFGGVYVPRKAVPRGYRKRALAAVGTGRRSFTRSQLPDALKDPSGRNGRGTPNRGRPDRGDPGRGLPDRG